MDIISRDGGLSVSLVRLDRMGLPFGEKAKRDPGGAFGLALDRK